jgi:hypothetical protein
MIIAYQSWNTNDIAISSTIAFTKTMSTSIWKSSATTMITTHTTYALPDPHSFLLFRLVTAPFAIILILLSTLATHSQFTTLDSNFVFPSYIPLALTTLVRKVQNVHRGYVFLGGFVEISIVYLSRYITILAKILFEPFLLSNFAYFLLPIILLFFCCDHYVICCVCLVNLEPNAHMRLRSSAFWRESLPFNQIVWIWRKPQKEHCWT